MISSTNIHTKKKDKVEIVRSSLDHETDLITIVINGWNTVTVFLPAGTGPSTIETD